MKKIIALMLLLMFLISAACIASPYVAYADSNDELNDRVWEQSYRNEWKEYREERRAYRQAQQTSDVEYWLQKRKQKNEELFRQARIQAEKEEQERLIRIQQRKQQQQKIFLCVGAVAALGIACLYIKRKSILKWASANIATRKITSLQISQIFLILFLLIITTDRFSYGIYTLLRILTTTISVWSAMRTDNNILKLIFAFIAILFNPIILIELDRDEWQMIDVATAIFYLGIVIHSLIKARK